MPTNINGKNFWFVIPSWLFNAIFAAATLFLYNQPFFSKFYDIAPSISFFGGSVFGLCLGLYIVFNALFWGKLTKVLAIVILLINSIVYYFIHTYNLSIHKDTLINVLVTDVNEVNEIFCCSVLWYVLFLGILPSILVYKTYITQKNIWKEIVLRMFIGGIAVAVITLFLYANAKASAQVMRNNRNLIYWLVPVNYTGSTFSLIMTKIEENSGPIMPIANDVKMVEYWEASQKENLLVFVVGETARAANWAANGYEINTTEALDIYNNEIFNYSDMTSCGTSTEISLNCMFSIDERKNFNLWKARKKENLVDVVKDAGYDVWWRDNNSGCKGICARVTYEDVCLEPSCYDDVLIDGLVDNLRSNVRNSMVVLHQKGSHGPNYYLRYPDEEDYYQPSCKTERLDKCSDEEIINSYNNTIRYTAKNLANLIAELKTLEDIYNVVLIYVSDHGESLGEKGIYLHGAPYHFAPSEQKKIPFFVWMSQNSARNLRLKYNCLQKTVDKSHSHDNLFHMVLGILGIETSIYKKNLDSFSVCRF